MLEEREPDIFLKDDVNDQFSKRLNRKSNHPNGAHSPTNRIPLLEDVFKLLPHVPINLDIKINNDLLINKVTLFDIPFCLEAGFSH